ncbi:MAG: cytochrome c [Desulfitobacteriaceae bacterium]|nr:cytochrome c [Desulfitobacteriaceae bacterium]MDI6914027.1 cytochrome c [Desulfitobacteriaceae bacterium]
MSAAATQGQTLYTQQCQACHGDKGSGGLKALNGGLANYSSQAALATFIQASMPQGNAHLSAAQASDLAAYLFFINHR